MASTRLYSKALGQFRQDILGRKKQSDTDILNEFLREGSTSSLATPSSVKQTAAKLATDAGKKFSVGVVPKAWVDTIMGNIDNIVAVGGFLTKNAPESVGMAWFAISLTLKAISNNYNLYALFGQGLTDVTEVMIIITHYDRLYDKPQKPGTKISDLMDKLFRDTVAAYIAVLDFAFSVKKHLSAGSLDKLRHAFKDFFGTQAPKFQAKLASIASHKDKILESSHGVFQDKTMHRFGEIQDVLKDIDHKNSQQLEMQQESRQALADIYDSLSQLKGSVKSRTPWEDLLGEFSVNKKKLCPLPEAGTMIERLLVKRQEGTLTWIFKNETYRNWVNSKQNATLCVLGGPGSGKSTVLASISRQIHADKISDTPLVDYVSCAVADDIQSVASGLSLLSRVQNTLIYQIYRIASEDEGKMSLLEDCNRIFRPPKRDHLNLGAEQAAQNNTLPEFAQAMRRLIVALQRDLVIMVDAIDLLSDSDQRQLYRDLRRISDDTSISCQVSILIGSRSNSSVVQLASTTTPSIDLSTNSNQRSDVKAVLDFCLENLPGWLDQEKEYARQTVLAKSGSSFTYIEEVAIPFLQQPFQRPVSTYLAKLPESMKASFDQALLSIDPNYLDLLKLAVKWSLFSPRSVTVKEVLEAFSGVYTTEDLETSDTTSDDYDAQANALEIQQISSACGPFLALDRTKDGQTLVRLQDSRQVRDFCLHPPKPEVRSANHGDQICENCKVAMNGVVSLHIDPKIAHFEIALMMLKTLNNRLFQSRFDLLRDLDTDHVAKDSTESEDESDEESSEEADETDGDDISENGNESEGEEEAYDDGDEGEDEAYDDDGDEAEQGEDGEDSDELKSEISANEISDYFWSDPNVDWLVQGGDPYIPIYTRDLDVRREIMDWPWHLRETEKLWSQEERRTNPLWLEYNQKIEAELLRFTENEVVFKNWQKLWQIETLCGTLKSPICLAASLGLATWVESLLDAGADVNEVSGHRNVAQSSGEFANVHQNLDLLQLLLRRGADFYYAKFNNYYNTPADSPALHLWLDRYGMERAVVKAFVDHETNFGAKDQWGWTGLHTFAWRMGDIESLDLVMGSHEHRPDINAVDDFGETPLFKLLWRKDLPLELLKAFVNVDGIHISHDANNSQQPLALASQWGSLGIVNILVDAKADLHDRDKRMRTALHRAAEGGHVNCIEALLGAGLELDILDGAKITPLQYAAWNGHQAAVRYLVKSGADILASDDRDRNSLFKAILGQHNDQGTAMFLLTEMTKAGHHAEQINKVTTGGRSSLRQAATREFTDVLRDLLKYIFEKGDAACKSAIDLGDVRFRRTPLHCAVASGNSECVRLLVSYGADTKQTDRERQTPLMLARDSFLRCNEKRFEETLLHLIDADPAAACLDAELPSIAAANGSLPILRRLRDLQADLTKTDGSGWTPLAHAKYSGQKKALNFLKHNISWGSDLPSRWTSPHSKAVLDEAGLSLQWKGDHRACIVTDKPLPPNFEHFYFEVVIDKLSKDHKLAIGFCTLGASHHTFPGLSSKTPTALSWSLDGSDGRLYHRYPAVDAKETKECFLAGDTVGCGVDLESHTIWFTRNGIKIQESFTDVNGRLYPVLGLSAPVSLRTNFGREPFSWKLEETDP